MAFRLFGKKDKTNEESEQEQLETFQRVEDLPMDKIFPNQFQPRTVFNEDKIAELAQTIEEHGIIQPIVVRKMDPDYYEIIAGERRFRAALSLEMETIPAVVQEMDDEEVAAIALIENLQREQLTPIEEAKAYRNLLDIQDVTQELLATRLGKSQSAIANKLRLLKLPEEIQAAVLDKQISERHARSLLVLETEEQQLEILKEVLANHWNVKQTETRIQELTTKKETKPKKTKPKHQSISRDIRIALNTIKQSVKMVKDNGMELDVEEEESDDFYRITIQIPKKK